MSCPCPSFDVRQERPAHLAHDLMRNRQPQSCAMFFRCEEGVKQVIDVGRRDTVSTVHHADRDPALFSTGGERYRAPPSGLASMALIIRLRSTCSSCSGSHSTRCSPASNFFSRRTVLPRTP